MSGAASAFDRRFPFPGREASVSELERDPCYAKIPVEARDLAIGDAWQAGVRAADEFVSEWRSAGVGSFAERARTLGLSVEVVDADRVVGTVRYFSEYFSGKRVIKLYARSIALWAERNGLSEEEARDMIIAHELYHFLELTRYGLTSRRYTVPMLSIGRIKIGRTGIRALSEIGAHAFVRRCYEIGGEED